MIYQIQLKISYDLDKHVKYVNTLVNYVTWDSFAK